MRTALALVAVCTLVLWAPPAHALAGTRVSSGLTMWQPFTAPADAGVAADVAPLNSKGAAVDLAVAAQGASWLPLAAGAAYEPAGLAFNGSCVGCPSGAPALGSGLAVSSLADAEFDNKRGFSLEAWFRTPNVTQTTSIVDAALGPGLAPACPVGAESLRSFALSQRGDSLVFSLADQASASNLCRQCAAPAGAVVAGAITHVMATLSAPRASSTLRLYVNGVDVACSATVTASADLSAAWSSGPNARPLAVAGPAVSSSAAQLWTGTLYTLALYARELSPAEVATNYASGEYNHVPVAVAATVTTPEDVAVLVALNGTDPYDSVFTVRVTGLPAAGALYQVVESPAPTIGAAITAAGTVVTSALNRVWYVPPANASGVALALFAFTVDDTEAVSAPAAITVDVAPVDDQPVVQASVASVSAGGGPVAVPGLFVIDADNEVVRLVVQADAGLVTLGTTAGLTCVVGTCAGDTAFLVEGSLAAVNTALASLTYTTTLLASGTDTILARVNDLSGGAWSEATVGVTVTTTC